MAAVGVAAMALSQCALPPGTAWTVIRKDGVKDYFAISWGKKPVPEYVKELVPEAFGLPAPEVNEDKEEAREGEPELIAEGEAFPEAPGTMPEDWMRPVEPVFPLMATEPPSVAEGGAMPIGGQGFGVNPLLGDLSNDDFDHVDLPPVKDPLVAIGEDLNRAAPGLKLKDLEAAGPSEDVVAHLAEGLKGGVKPEGALVSKEDDEAQLKEMAGSNVVKAVDPKVNDVEDKAKPELARAEGNDVNVAKFLPETLVGSVGEEVPFGLLVEGRPGYVRSPYAQSHQIVDVTGLKVGTSVKCPFSGKFFRVPAAHAAMNATLNAKGAALGEIESPVDQQE